jgi:hypothetical protein
LTKIAKLAERVDELAGDGQGPALTTEEANSVRQLWIQLHYTDEEAREYRTLHERHEVLFQKYEVARSLSPEELEEWNKNGQRCAEIAHDTVMRRVAANRAMRDRLWPELAPRALRYWKLVDKPRDQLTDVEAEELNGLLEWFSKLQAEALEASCQALEAAGKPAT